VSEEVLLKMATMLADHGLLIEAGFAGFRGMCMSQEAEESQIVELRIAFFGGAQHLFNSIMHVLDPEEEPTTQDMQRMNKIAEELQRFGEQFDMMVKMSQSHHHEAGHA
jgi:hypothetical protein